MIVTAACVLLAVGSTLSFAFDIFMLDWVAHALGFILGAVVAFYFGEWLATGHDFLRGFYLAAYYSALLPGVVFAFAFASEPIRDWFADISSVAKSITWAAWIVALICYGLELNPF